MIRSYLSSHPGASDTRDGVLWWLTRQCYAELAPSVQPALDYLVEEGHVTKRRRRDGTVFYALPDRSAP